MGDAASSGGAEGELQPEGARPHAGGGETAAPRQLRYLDADALRAALSMDDLLDALEEVFVAVAAGEAEAPPRTTLTQPRSAGGADCVTLLMPAVWRSRGVSAAKLVTYVADNPKSGRPAVQGVAVLVDAATGAPALIVDAATLTVRRTGALVGLSCRYLARPDSAHMALIGTGALADDIVSAVRSVLPIERVSLYNRTRRAAEELAARLTAVSEEGALAVEVADGPEAAAREADVLVTATSSLSPVVDGALLRPGTHVAAVGNFSPRGRELDGATVAACRRFVDTVEGALGEAGELLLAAEEGLIPAGEAGIEGDLAGLASGALPGRRDDREMTLFKSVGTAYADLAALAAVAEARDAGIAL